jgi:hypothetical protein
MTTKGIYNLLFSSFFLLISLNGFSQQILGEWKRNDGSVYKFSNDKAVLTSVGYHLKKGQFSEGDIKIRDIFINNGTIHGFRKINNTKGETVRWEKIRLVKRNKDNIQIKDLNGNQLALLIRISGNNIKNDYLGIDGVWKRKNDGSLYKFENDIAVLDRVGWFLEKGKFNIEQVKIRNIAQISERVYSGKTRINDTEGNLVSWRDVKIYKDHDKLQIKRQNTDKTVILEKYTYHLSNKNQNQTKQYRPESPVDDHKNKTPDIYLDKNIPETDVVNHNTYALIIGNENYTKYQTSLSAEANVKFAMNDAKVFKRYCHKTLGIPEANIKLGVNRISSQMKRDIKWLISRAKYGGPEVKLIFYYAGHGFPNPKNNEKYLMPVDITGSQVTDGIKLSKLYSQLVEYPANKVTVFLDACFSGGGRKQGLLAARAVKIEPKKNTIGNGNLVVFSGSSGDQESLFHKEKQHGIFTYYLLKKIQETEGNVTYESLRNYLKKRVPMKAIDLFYKEQVPEVNISRDVKDKWKSWKLNN